MEKLAGEVQAEGHSLSPSTVAALLHDQGNTVLMIILTRCFPFRRRHSSFYEVERALELFGVDIKLAGDGQLCYNSLGFFTTHAVTFPWCREVKRLELRRTNQEVV